MSDPTLSAAPGHLSRVEVPTPTRWLALGAVAGPVLFTLAWFVLGFFNHGYTLGGDSIPSSPISHPISGLGMGATGPYMNAAFILSGLLLLAGVIGVFQTAPAGHRPAARRACAAGLALSPLGLILAGVFTIEHDLPHFAGFGLAALTPVVTFVATGIFLRGVPGWRRFGTYLAIFGSPLTLLAAVMYLATFDEASTAAGEGIAGLLSRILGLAVHAWFVAMGWYALRQSTPRS